MIGYAERIKREVRQGTALCLNLPLWGRWHGIALTDEVAGGQ